MDKEVVIKKELINERLGRLLALLDMLIGYGVDPSELETSTQ